MAEFRPSDDRSGPCTLLALRPKQPNACWRRFFFAPIPAVGGYFRTSWGDCNFYVARHLHRRLQEKTLPSPIFSPSSPPLFPFFSPSSQHRCAASFGRSHSVDSSAIQWPLVLSSAVLPPPELPSLWRPELLLAPRHFVPELAASPRPRLLKPRRLASDALLSLS